MEIEKIVNAVASHWNILNELYGRERYASELAKVLNKKAPAISKATGELVSAGLIKFRLSPSQKRGGVRKYYQLTNRGRVIVDAILYAKKVPQKREYTDVEFKMRVSEGKLLKHSLLSLLKGPHTHRYYVSGEEIPNHEVASRWMPNLLSHLKTGYGEIYELYEKCEELSRRRDQAEKGIKEQIKSEAKEKLKDLQPTLENLAEVVVGKLRALHRDYKSVVDEDKNWQIRDGDVWCGGYRLSENGDLKKVRSFVVKPYNELLEAYREVIELENEYYDKRKTLESKLTDTILKQIESGKPLRGHCNACEDLPRITKG